jgi:hemoglobin
MMTIGTLRAFGCAFALIYCLAGAPLTAADTTATLYQRLGGKEAITAVASGLVDRILDDSRVNAWFAHAAASAENTAAYKAKLADFVCQATGGPCTYTGMDMVTAHRGRRVTSAAFEAVVQDLTAVLDTLKVKPEEKKDLLALVGTLKSSIVQP